MFSIINILININILCIFKSSLFSHSIILSLFLWRNLYVWCWLFTQNYWLLSFFYLCCSSCLLFDIFNIYECFLIQIYGFVYYLISFLSPLEPLHQDFFVFKFFIVFEKSMDLMGQVLRKLLNVVVMVNRLIIVRNCNDFIV